MKELDWQNRTKQSMIQKEWYLSVIPWVFRTYACGWKSQWWLLFSSYLQSFNNCIISSRFGERIISVLRFIALPDSVSLPDLGKNSLLPDAVIRSGAILYSLTNCFQVFTPGKRHLLGFRFSALIFRSTGIKQYDKYQRGCCKLQLFHLFSI